MNASAFSLITEPGNYALPVPIHVKRESPPPPTTVSLFSLIKTFYDNSSSSVSIYDILQAICSAEAMVPLDNTADYYRVLNRIIINTDFSLAIPT